MNESQPGTSTSNEFQFGPSTSNEQQPGTSTSKETRPGSSTLNEPQPGPSTLNESQAGYSDTEVSHVKASNSAYLLITPKAVRPFPKALPRKSTGKQRKRETTIITETPEKDRLLLENMMDIFKKKTSKTEKRNLKHVKQIFKSNLTDQELKKKKKQK